LTLMKLSPKSTGSFICKETNQSLLTLFKDNSNQHLRAPNATTWTSHSTRTWQSNCRSLR